MDRVAEGTEKREDIAVGKCAVLKEEQEGCREVEKETKRDVPYDENTRYYWF